MKLHSDFFDWKDTLIENIKSSIKKSYPAKIIDYDPIKRTATVQVLSTITTLRGKTEEIAPLYDIPVQQPRTSDFFFHQPIGVGTLGIVQFFDKSIDNYKRIGGKAASLKDPQWNDCVFIAGFYPQNDPIPNLDNEQMLFGAVNNNVLCNLTTQGTFGIKNLISNFDLKHDGEMILKNALAKFGFQADGDVLLENALARLGFKPDGEIDLGVGDLYLGMKPNGELTLGADEFFLKLNEPLKYGKLGYDDFRLELSPLVGINIGTDSLNVGLDTIGNIVAGNDTLRLVIGASGVYLKTDRVKLGLPVGSSGKASLQKSDPSDTSPLGFEIDGNDVYHAGNISEGGLETAKVLLTEEGGIAVKLINNSGSNSVKGTVVSASPSVDSAFILQSNEYDAIGVVYENGIANGSECWVVVSGIAEVLLEDSTSATRGYWAKSSTVDGRANITTASSSIGSLDAATHFKQIGHCIETKSSGTNVLAKVILSFN